MPRQMRFDAETRFSDNLQVPSDQTKTTISAKEWWNHGALVTRLALSEMGWWAIVRGATVAALAYVAQYIIGLRTVNDTRKMVFTSLGAALFVCLMEVAWRLLLITV